MKKILSLLLGSLFLLNTGNVLASGDQCSSVRSPRCEDTYYYEPYYKTFEYRNEFRMEADNVVDLVVTREVETHKSLSISAEAGVDIDAVIGHLSLDFLMKREGSERYVIRAMWPTKAGNKYELTAGMKIGVEKGYWVHMDEYCNRKEEKYIEARGEIEEYVHSRVIG